MSQDKVHGLDAHPEKERLNALYSGAVQSGQHTVVLDDRAWGKSTNLFCYFSNIANGEKYRLSVFHRQGYRPYDNGISFRDAAIGSRYIITVDESKNGLPKFLAAVALS